MKILSYIQMLILKYVEKSNELLKLFDFHQGIDWS